MVKSVLGVKHQGLRDWVIQRVSAILMTIYTIGLVFYLISHSGLSYAEWHGLFARHWMKIATILVVLATLMHAWVGMWTIFTDYVKNSWIRTFLNLLVFLMLAACFFWALLILWSL